VERGAGCAVHTSICHLQVELVLDDFTVEQQLQLPGTTVQPLHGVMPHATLVDLTVNMTLTRCQHSIAMPVLSCAPILSIDDVCHKDAVAWRLACRSGCLQGHVLGAADLFEVATVRQLAEHLKVLAGAAAAQPDASISSLPLMSAEEQQLVLHTFNDTAAPLPTLCVHQFFEQQAARTPVAKCLMAGAGGISLTYAEVNSRANQLAHHLIVAGVSADTPVAVLMDKCFEAYIALIAILKAGGEHLRV
jgi:non-ribosomal peptide synthetase component F